MARITIEDCITLVPNRFDLCLYAADRAKRILAGAASTIESNEKAPVLALREVAEGALDIEHVKRNVVAASFGQVVAAEAVSSSTEVADYIKSEGADAVGEDVQIEAQEE